MSTVLLKCTQPNDVCVYVMDDEFYETPNDLVKCATIVHVREIDPMEEDEDYTTPDPRGGFRYLKYTTKSGKELGESGQALKTIDPNAVTNPDCLIELGLEERVVYVGEDEEEIDDDQEGVDDEDEESGGVQAHGERVDEEVEDEADSEEEI